MQLAGAGEPIVYTELSEAVNKRLKRDWDAARASRANLHSLTIYVWLRAPFFFCLFVWGFFFFFLQITKPSSPLSSRIIRECWEDHNKRSLTGVQGGIITAADVRESLAPVVKPPQ